MTRLDSSLHRRSIRLRDFDYSQSGAYFLTIVAYGRRSIFGSIENGHLRLNDRGRVVETEWLKTPLLRLHIIVDEFVVMPNHFHGILIIDSPSLKGTARRAPTHEAFGRPVAASVPTVIRSFKSAATKGVHELGDPSILRVWQRNYFEHVVRNDDSLNRIREYILTNPQRWDFDPENPGNRGTDDFDRWLNTFDFVPI